MSLDKALLAQSITRWDMLPHKHNNYTIHNTLFIAVCRHYNSIIIILLEKHVKSSTLYNYIAYIRVLIKIICDTVLYSIYQRAKSIPQNHV